MEQQRQRSRPRCVATQVRNTFDKTPFLCDRETVGSPRQARDKHSGNSNKKCVLRRAYYPAKQVAVARSGWGSSDSYLGVKGGDSAMTHQDLDHGSFVFETSGQRWVCDLGIENYLLAGA